MKYINLFFVFIFIVFAALQYNDPDPWLWGPIYLYAAWICFQASRKKFYPKLCLGGMAFYLAYALYLFLDKNGVWNWATQHHAENLVQTMKATKPWIEETREFGGLLIVFGALLMNYLAGRRKAV